MNFIEPTTSVVGGGRLDDWATEAPYLNIISPLLLATSATPGSQSTQVNIFNKGNAVAEPHSKLRRRSADDNDNIILVVEMAVSSLAPTSGGTAGGTTLTITGNGFGTSKSGISVDIGGENCVIMSVMPSEIVCKTTAHSAGVVDLTVSAVGFNAKLEASYTYDPSLEPNITALEPARGPVYGGTLLTIKGNAFPDVISEVEVMIGSKRCDVKNTTSTEITCTVPRNPPGDAKVFVDTQRNGRASFNGGQSINYTYVLTVTDISPRRGSLNGDTVVTIHGEGFHANKSQNVIMLGFVKCKVMECNETRLKCTTPGGGKTVNIDNSGSHPGIWLSVVIS